MTKFLTRREAADMLRMAPGTLSNLAARGEGPPFCKTAARHGGRALYRESDLVKYLEQRTGPIARRTERRG